MAVLFHLVIFLSASVFALNQCTTTGFIEAPTVTMAGEPQSIVSADFDGDGRIDLATVSNTLTVSVTRNISSGGVTEFAPRVDFPLTAGGLGIAAGDIDGDGAADIVTSNYFSSTISVLRNTSSGPGSISFATAVNFSVGGSPRTTWLADINGDSKLDAAVANEGSNSVSVLLNSGTGPGSVSFAAPANFTVGSQPRQVVVADFDGDSKGDIATVNYQASTVSVLRNTSTMPTSVTFAPKVDFNVGLFPFSESASLTAADFDGDGKTDIAAGHLSPRSVSVLRNTSPSAGSVTFAPREGFKTGFGGYRLLTRDLNGDSKVDIVVANFYSNSVSILLNTSVTGSLSFASRIEFGIGQSPTGITGADFDSDGQFDLAVSNSRSGNVSILRRLSTTRVVFAGRPEFAIGGENPVGAVVIDLDNDGKDDAVSVNRATNNISALRNTTVPQGYLQFAPHVTVAAGSSSSPQAIDTGDFDGDGRSDIVTANETFVGSVSVFRNTSSGPGSITFASFVDFGVGIEPNFVKTGDIDGDGKVDVIVSNRGSDNISILRNTSTVGNPGFATHVDFPVVNEPRSIALSDLDGDGKLDLVVSNVISTMISVFRNTSTPDSLSFAPRQDIDFAVNPFYLIAGDFDLDGKADIVVAGRLSNGPSVSILRNTTSSPGMIQFAPKVDIPLFDGPGTPGFSGGADVMAAADFNLDGKLDIVVKNGLTVALILNTSTGTGSISFGSRTESQASQTTALSVGDFDDNGGPDVAYPGVNADSIGILQNPCGSQRAVPFDFDGDGKTDVGIYRQSVGEWWYLRSSDGQVPAFQFGSATDRIVPADYTGDGKTDMAFYRPATGEWFVIRSEDLSYFSFPFGASEDIPIPADYDGDGKADPAVFRPSTGLWIINRSSDHETTFVQFGTSGDVPVAADYDGDGKADVAIFRPSLGQWWLNRTTAGVLGIAFGESTDKNVQGDYTGDGKADVAFWRPATGDWFILRSEDMSYYSVPFGIAPDVPAPGDYDGDGKFDTTVFRPANGLWFIQRSTAGTLSVPFGANGDRPIPNAFIP